jgi:membrane protein YqaA with SNARE-associated domain
VWNYLLLFSSAFVAATLLPAQSEALLLALLHLSEQSVVLLIFFATLGNVLGSLVNWWLGTQFQRFKDRKWFPFSAKRLEQAQSYYQRSGSWVLLLSWMPIIGDPITLISGVLKENIYRFLVLVTIAKSGRYIILTIAYFYSMT